MTSDGELIQRAATGDRSAFEDLYRRYARPVFGLALRRLGDRGARRTPSRRRSPRSGARPRLQARAAGPVRPWLYAVARNAIVDRARARTRHPGGDRRTSRLHRAPARRAGRAGLRRLRVHRALEELPEREREVLELAYWSGLSQSEVAEFLGIPLGTVKTRTRNGLSRLADLLEEDLG